jgi:hypothetical protein
MNLLSHSTCFLHKRTLMAASSKVTTDRETIRKWAEEREGKPATVVGTGGREDAGLLRIDFPGRRGNNSLKEISWEEFFEKFEEKNLALLYQDATASGKTSRFNKIIKRETANRNSISNTERKRNLEMEDQQNLEKEISTEEYAELFSKDIDELKSIAEQKNIPNPEEFDKEELVMAIELADLAEE